MMKHDVQDVLKELGVDHLYRYRLEIRALPQILHMDERIYGVTSGVFESRRWMAVVTGRHLYLIAVHPVSKTEVKMIERSAVQQVQVAKGLLFAKITIIHSEGEILLEHVAKASVPSFVQSLEGHINH